MISFELGIGQRFSLEAMRRRFNTCDFQHGRCEIDQFDKSIANFTALKHTGQSEHQRHTDGFVIKVRTFEIDSVITQHLAVIGHKNHQGVVCLSCFFQRRENASNFVIDVIAHRVVRGTDFTTIIIGVQAASFDPIYEQAAQDCGASTWQVYREVTIPILWPGIFSAAIFAFLLSWGNFYQTYSLSGTARSLPTFVFAGMGQGASPLFPAIATVTFGVGLTLIVIADWLRRRAVVRTSSGGQR